MGESLRLDHGILRLSKMKPSRKKKKRDPETTLKGALARIVLLEAQVRGLMIESGRAMLP